MAEDDDDELFKLAATRKASQMEDDNAELRRAAAAKAAKKGGGKGERQASVADDDDELFKLAATRKQSQMEDDNAELRRAAAAKKDSRATKERASSVAEDDDELFKLAATRKQSQMEDDNAELKRLASSKTSKAVAAAAAAAKAPARADVLFLFGSETGNSQEICRSMHAEAQEMGIGAKCMALDEVKFEEIDAKRSPLLVIVSSSTGDGEPPENARIFYGAIKNPALPKTRFAGVKFALLGLGDSSYTTLHAVPKVRGGRGRV